MNTWQVYLSGEIHTDWREQIEAGTRAAELPVAFTAPVTNHGLQRRLRRCDPGSRGQTVLEGSQRRQA